MKSEQLEAKNIQTKVEYNGLKNNIQFYICMTRISSRSLPCSGFLRQFKLTLCQANGFKEINRVKGRYPITDTPSTNLS